MSGKNKMHITKSFENFFSVFIIAFAFLFPHFKLPMFSYTIIVLIIVWLFLKIISHENFNDIFFSFKNFKIKSIWIGALTAIILFCFVQFLFLPLAKKLLPHEIIDLKDFDFIKGNFINYIFILLMAFLVGGFYEEIIFHGFIFTRLEKIFGSKKGFIISFVITNLLFCAYHFQQGLLGIINAFIAGCFYHILILRYNRNLWYGIFLHTFFDFIGLTFIYFGYN